MTEQNRREWLTVNQFRERNPQFGKNFVYQAVRDGLLPSVRIGSKILIPSDALDQILESKVSGRSVSN